MILSVAILKAKGACAPALAKVGEIFGDEPFTVTEALCERHAAEGSWEWAAKHLLTGPAHDEYCRVVGAAWAEHRRVVDAAWAEYRRVGDPAWAEYNRVVDLASAEYNRACAIAFGRLAEEQP